MARSKWVNMRTRVSVDVGAKIKEMATPDYPVYKVVRDIIVAHICGDGFALRRNTMDVLRNVARETGYVSAEALAVDLAKAFLKVWQYNNNQLDDDEPTPSEEIRDMFAQMSNGTMMQDCDEKGYSIGRRI